MLDSVCFLPQLMKRFFTILPLLAFAVLVSSCGSKPVPVTDTQIPVDTQSGAALSSSGAAVVTSTRNVSYVGTLGELGSSIYQEGTHRLTLSDGQFILLQSTDQNLSLNAYLGKQVEVRGSVQPTVEGNAEIMHVEEVTVLEASSGSESSSASSKNTTCGGIAGLPCPSGLTCVDDPSDHCDPNAGGADCSGICVMKADVSSSSKTSSSVKTLSSSLASIPAVSSSLASDTLSSDSSAGILEAQIVLMAKQKYDSDALWTQKYCSSHTSFCIPAHKNWYFKSFGATTSNLWHVEFSIAAVEELHTGSIVLNLVSGTTNSMDAKDGQVKTEGNDVVGFKDWTNGTHFELIADARLREAVTYMLSHITEYTSAE